MPYNEAMLRRYYIVFEGRVQGVGFRWTTQMMAMKQNLTGWITNLDNGDVAMQIQGENLDLYWLLDELRKSSRWAVIYDYSAKEIPPEEHEHNFTVR